MVGKPKIGAALSQGGLTELKRRFLFVLLGVIVYRIGAHIPVPGIDPERLAILFHQHQSGLLGLFNMFSGGALKRLTVFALGVMPYISASIIMQLFTAVSPKLEQLKKEGEAGQRKINQYTRYGTAFLAAFQAIGISRWLVGQGIVINPGLSFYFIAAVTLMTGTMFIVWLGEQMTERGIGNGISLIIFAGIVSRFPAAIAQVLQQVRQGQTQVISLLLLIGVVVLVTAFVVFVERAQRRITVNYAQKQAGRKLYAAQSTHLPLKINMSGVIPPIFASSIILFPATVAQWFGGQGSGILSDISAALSPGQPLYLACFTVAIVLSQRYSRQLKTFRRFYSRDSSRGTNSALYRQGDESFDIGGSGLFSVGHVIAGVFSLSMACAFLLWRNIVVNCGGGCDGLYGANTVAHDVL